MPEDWRTSREAAVTAHATFFFATLVGPLLMLVFTRTRRDSVAYTSAAQAFNWQAGWVTAAALFGLLNLPDIGLLRLVSFVGLAVVIVVGVTSSVRAVRAASKGRHARYPFRLRLVRGSE